MHAGWRLHDCILCNWAWRQHLSDSALPFAWAYAYHQPWFSPFHIIRNHCCLPRDLDLHYNIVCINSTYSTRTPHLNSMHTCLLSCSHPSVGIHSLVGLYHHGIHCCWGPKLFTNLTPPGSAHCQSGRWWPVQREGCSSSDMLCERTQTSYMCMLGIIRDHKCAGKCAGRASRNREPQTINALTPFPLHHARSRAH